MYIKKVYIPARIIIASTLFSFGVILIVLLGGKLNVLLSIVTPITLTGIIISVSFFGIFFTACIEIPYLFMLCSLFTNRGSLNVKAKNKQHPNILKFNKWRMTKSYIAIICNIFCFSIIYISCGAIILYNLLSYDEYGVLEPGEVSIALAIILIILSIWLLPIIISWISILILNEKDRVRLVKDVKNSISNSSKLNLPVFCVQSSKKTNVCTFHKNVTMDSDSTEILFIDFEEYKHIKSINKNWIDKNIYGFIYITETDKESELQSINSDELHNNLILQNTNQKLMLKQTYVQSKEIIIINYTKENWLQSLVQEKFPILFNYKEEEIILLSTVLNNVVEADYKFTHHDAVKDLLVQAFSTQQWKNKFECILSSLNTLLLIYYILFLPKNSNYENSNKAFIVNKDYLDNFNHFGKKASKIHENVVKTNNSLADRLATKLSIDNIFQENCKNSQNFSELINDFQKHRNMIFHSGTIQETEYKSLTKLAWRIYLLTTYYLQPNNLEISLTKEKHVLFQFNEKCIDAYPYAIWDEALFFLKSVAKDYCSATYFSPYGNIIKEHKL